VDRVKRDYGSMVRKERVKFFLFMIMMFMFVSNRN
jgi:hypothetical protein